MCSIIFEEGGRNSMKRKEDLPECPIATTVSLVGSKWKLLIIRNLMKRPWRFNELQKSLDGISQKVLTESLRQLTGDGLVYRKDHLPRVDNFMCSFQGFTLSAVLKNISKSPFLLPYLLRT